MPSKKNKNLDHSKTIDHPDGSKTFFDHKGNSVTYDKHGNPDFSPHATKKVDSPEFNGNRKHDNRIANRKIGESKTPSDSTWHHEPGGDSMILVPKDIHSTFPHTGGASTLIHG